jgi:hypothetical protein
LIANKTQLLAAVIIGIKKESSVIFSSYGNHRESSGTIGNHRGMAMDWVLIGVVAGSLVVQGFGNKEACMGRVATLKEQKIEAKCAPLDHLEAPPASYVSPLTGCCILRTIGCTPC